MVEYLERKAVLDIMLRPQTMYGAYMAIAHMEPAKNADVVERKHGKWINPRPDSEMLELPMMTHPSEFSL